MLWTLIILAIGITLAILYEKLCLDSFVEFISIFLIALGLTCMVVSPVLISYCFEHTETVPVRYIDGTIIKDDDSPIYLIQLDSKSYWDWHTDVRTYELKQHGHTLVGETKDKSKILAWFEKPDAEFKF